MTVYRASFLYGQTHYINGRQLTPGMFSRRRNRHLAIVDGKRDGIGKLRTIDDRPDGLHVTFESSGWRARELRLAEGGWYLEPLFGGGTLIGFEVSPVEGFAGAELQPVDVPRHPQHPQVSASPPRPDVNLDPLPNLWH